MLFCRLIKKFNPFELLKDRYLKACFRYDCDKYRLQSSIDKNSTNALVSQMRVICHTIEKAFSLPDCRDDFGKQKIESLIRLYFAYSNNPRDNNALEYCHSIIYKYYLFRKERHLDVSFIPNEFHNYNGTIESGAQDFTQTQPLCTFGDIAFSRHSIRNYAEALVKEEDVIKAIKIAQTAPSACNRQATRVYSCLNKDIIRNIQNSHGGIRSFGTPGVIFAITQDLNLYLNEYERNTWLVDGGIFCMNMLYALQSVNIVSCPVIWGGMEDEDERMASLLGIPDNERIVILIVGGYLPNEGCKTPYSPKRPIEDILHIIN